VSFLYVFYRVVSSLLTFLSACIILLQFVLVSESHSSIKKAMFLSSESFGRSRNDEASGQFYIS